MSPKDKSRILELDCAKGLVILLVVIGHIAQRDIPKDALWYIEIRNFIYMFHMPVFMYISGFLYKISRANYEDKRLVYAKKKIIRILPSYIIFGLIILIGKYYIGGLYKISNPVVGGFIDEFVHILIEPRNSVASSLWFIYTLLELYMTALVFERLVNNHICIIIGISCLLYWFVVANNLFTMHDYVKHAVFFFLGVACYGANNNILQTKKIYMLGVFFAFLGICLYTPKLIGGVNVYLVAGALGGVLVHYGAFHTVFIKTVWNAP